MIITPENLYKKRRDFLKLGAGALISSSVLASKLSALISQAILIQTNLKSAMKNLLQIMSIFMNFQQIKKRLYHWHKISILKIGKSISVEK